MSIRVVRLGSPRARGEGIRLGTVRRPPRGVPKHRFARDNWYDTWLPELSPSEALVQAARRAISDADWRRFMKQYRREMAAPEKVHLLATLAALSHTANFSVGCYCEDESHCHRSILRELLRDHGASLAG